MISIKDVKYNACSMAKVLLGHEPKHTRMRAHTHTHTHTHTHARTHTHITICSESREPHQRPAFLGGDGQGKPGGLDHSWV